MKLVPWRRKPEERSAIGFQQWLDWFQFQGSLYPVTPSLSYPADAREEIDSSFVGYATQVFKANGVVFACMAARSLLFQEARFQFRGFSSGRPGDLFGTADLEILEKPWPNGTTRDLLARMIQDIDLAGNFYATIRNGQVKRMRPDWVSIVVGTNGDAQRSDPNSLEAQLLGYVYHPGGRYSGKDPVTLLPDAVAHFAPMPDPVASYRGMSWLTTIIREVMADSAATEHKLKYFENGATPNLAVKLDQAVTKAAFDEWVAAFREQHEGVANAYKTLILGGGADFTVVGSDLQQVDFKITQGAGETRIAAAAGVPPVVVGLSEGLEAATYSNYQLAMRRFADLTMRPLWGSAAGSLATLVAVPPKARLDYDARYIPALAESEENIAANLQKNAVSIRTLVDGGFEPDTVVAAVEADDLSRLVHTGLPSVQTQPPPAQIPSPPTNGSGDVAPATVPLLPKAKP